MIKGPLNLGRFSPNTRKRKEEVQEARWERDGYEMRGDSAYPSQRRRNYWKAIQRRMASKVCKQDSFHAPIERLAGLDVAYSNCKAFSAAVVINYRTLEVTERKTARSSVSVPYIPSFLAFREFKPLARVMRKLQNRVDVTLVNAHGIAHPEKCGCASYLGVVLDIPTIGVASKRLFGTVSETGPDSIKYLKEEEEIIGAQVTTRVGSKPVYISVGHKVGLASAIGIVQRTSSGNRMPEPLRLAHELSNAMRKRNSAI